MGEVLLLFFSFLHIVKRLDRTGPDRTELDWTGPDWTGLDRTGPDWTGLD